MSLEREIAENVLVSLLAVNHWSLDKVYSNRSALREVGLLDFNAVGRLAVEEVAQLLAKGGYARGNYMNTLMAVRVCSMARVLSPKELAALADHVRAGRRGEAEVLLGRITGVGPAVLKNFWVLQER